MEANNKQQKGLNVKESVTAFTVTSAEHEKKECEIFAVVTLTKKINFLDMQMKLS